MRTKIYIKMSSLVQSQLNNVLYKKYIINMRIVVNNIRTVKRKCHIKLKRWIFFKLYNPDFINIIRITVTLDLPNLQKSIFYRKIIMIRWKDFYNICLFGISIVTWYFTYSTIFIKYQRFNIVDAMREINSCEYVMWVLKIFTHVDFLKENEFFYTFIHSK